MEHESDGDTNCGWLTWNVYQRISEETGRLRNEKKSRYYPDNWFKKICQNSEKSPRDLSWLAINQTPNLEIIKGIMSEKKTTLPSHRNDDWKTVKAQTEKINALLNITTSNFTELNVLIIARANLVSKKTSGFPWRTRTESQNLDG